MKTCLIVVCVMLLSAPSVVPAFAQTPSPQIIGSEMAACRGDAIRLCFFNIAQADALRACLRRNKSNLSVPCRSLIESRGN
jgi:hypothetical protein